MLVAMRHEEALELAGFELPPERRHALGHRGRRTDLFEALKHGSPCKAGLSRNQSTDPRRSLTRRSNKVVHPLRRIRESRLKPSDRKRDSTCRAWRSSRPESTQCPPGRTARAKAGARSSRGLSRMLANSRSALARRSAGCATPSASTTVTRDRTPLVRTFSAATETAIGSMSLAITFALSALAAAMARMPVPVPISRTRRGCSRLARRSSAMRQPRVVA